MGLVDDHEANLTAASAKLERSKLKSERMAAVLINVKAGIEHITDRIEAYRDDQQQLLQITDETVVEVLYQCESTVERLLAEAKSRTASSDDSNEVSSSIFNKNKDSIDLAQSVTDRQVMETRPFNQRVTLPTGDRNLDSIAEDDRDDDGGQDSVTDGDELTRDKIKKASGAFTTQHDRAQRKKERKKGKKKR